LMWDRLSELSARQPGRDHPLWSSRERALSGTGPTGVAFDGSQIWVTNFYSGNVRRLRIR